MKFFKAFLCACSLLLFSQGALADMRSEVREEPKIYGFHLIYENGTLKPDPTAEYLFEFIASTYVAPNALTAHSWRGEIQTLEKRVAAAFNFDPAALLAASGSTENAILVRAPYVSDAIRVDFFSPENELKFSIDTSRAIACNDDGICGSDFGENSENCPRDCPTVIGTPSPTPHVSGVSQQSFWRLGTILAAIGILVVLGAFAVIQLKR